MENILGIIMFILFIALRTMSDRKKGMNRGPKTKPLIQAEPAGPKKKRPVEAKAAPQVSKQIKPARTNPPPFPATPNLAEGASYYDLDQEAEKAAPLEEKKRPRLQPVVAAETAGSLRLSHDDLRRAVLWSEILGKPRAMRRSIR